MIHHYECTQCGSTEFEDAGIRRVRCVHCGSLYQVAAGEPEVVIQKGANVVFGRNADVDVHGGIDVEGGAKVEIQGKVTVRKGKKKQAFVLQLVQAGDGGKRKS